MVDSTLCGFLFFNYWFIKGIKTDWHFSVPHNVLLHMHGITPNAMVVFATWALVRGSALNT